MEENIERNFKWFFDHCDEIYNACGKCVVVIEDRNTISAFSNLKDAYRFYYNNQMMNITYDQDCSDAEHVTYDFTEINDFDINENIKIEYP